MPCLPNYVMFSGNGHPESSIAERRALSTSKVMKSLSMHIPDSASAPRVEHAASADAVKQKLSSVTFSRGRRAILFNCKTQLRISQFSRVAGMYAIG
jgi:hypothetical protein